MASRVTKQAASGAGEQQAFWRSRIGSRLLLSILAFSSLVTLAITAFDLFVDYRAGLSAIHKELENIQTGYAAPLGENLWNLERKQIAIQIRSIAALSGIGYVEVRESDTADSTAFVAGVGQRLAGAAERRDIPLPCNCGGTPRVIGVLHVEATLDRLYQNLYHRALIILAGESFKIFVTSAFILFIVHRLVTTHLLDFTRNINQYINKETFSLTA